VQWRPFPDLHCNIAQDENPWSGYLFVADQVGESSFQVEMSSRIRLIFIAGTRSWLLARFSKT
jgi:hypothetical protein